MAGLGWLPDLLANLTAQLAILSGGCALWWLAHRRWSAGAGAVLAAIAQVAWIATPRAPRVGADPRDLVRFLIHNAGPGNLRGAEGVGAAALSGADVVVLVEMSPEARRALDDPGLGADFPGREIRYPVEGQNGWTAVLSRWPVRLESGPAPDFPIALVVERPAGAFGLIALHAPSPRTAARWRAGNLLTASAVEWCARLAAQGLPVVIAGDLNSTPTGWRSRDLCRRAGVRRAKPMLRGAGTFPAGWVWPAQVALDDALVSPGVGVVTWRVTGAMGSDHRSVSVGLAIPVGSAPARNP